MLNIHRYILNLRHDKIVKQHLSFVNHRDTMVHMKDARVNVRVPSKLKKDLAEIADRKDRAFSDMIRHILKRFALIESLREESK